MSAGENENNQNNQESKYILERVLRTENPDPNLCLKVVLLGPTFAGAKTSLIHRYVYGSFPTVAEPTLGAYFLSKEIVVDGAKLNMNLWGLSTLANIHLRASYNTSKQRTDTSGQEPFNILIPLFARGAQIVLMCIDVTNAKSLEECRKFKKLADEICAEHFVVVGVGNKIDLAGQRAVSTEEARKFFEGLGVMRYFEASALTGEGVTELFEGAVRFWLESVPNPLQTLSEINGGTNPAKESPAEESPAEEKSKSKCAVQ